MKGRQRNERGSPLSLRAVIAVPAPKVTADRELDRLMGTYSDALFTFAATLTGDEDAVTATRHTWR
jgi:hypothetical protein